MADITYIDNGHGGPDPGTLSSKGQTEAKTNYNVAEFLANLQKSVGNGALLSNPQLIKMELTSRFDRANRLKVSTSLSIHHNAGKGEYTIIFYQMNNPKSKLLAECIAEEFLRTYPGRKVKVETKPSKKYIGKDYFAALAIPMMPAILIEFAFMDSKDIELIDTLNEQRVEAQCIHRGIQRYYALT